MGKKCSTCQVALPPNKARIVLEIRHLPGVTWKFWKFLIGLYTADINQEEFCTDEHMMDYLRNLSITGFPAKKK